MRIHYYKYNISLLTLLCALTACSNEDDVKIDGPKTPIELTVGVEGPQSRAAVITDEVAEKNYSAFGSPTDIWMAMQSDYVYLGTSANPDEKDYKGSDTGTKYCVTCGTTGTADGTDNPVNITGDKIRYWDDAHARSSALSIWALAVPGKTETSGISSWNTAAEWGGSNPTKTINWSIATAQDATTIVDNDLCFSNNIVDYSSASKTDRRLKFSKPASKFDEGKLVFYHALSKITIKMVEGDGFNTSSTSDFNLDNITLKGFSLSGTFNVAEGVFNSGTIGAATDITSMAQKEKRAEDMTLEALVMPGTDLSTADITDAVSFSIDGNAFKVSSETLVSKLREGDAGAGWNGIIEAGKNYIFTFRVSKTAVKVTATVKDWEVLNAEQDEPKITVATAYGQDVSDPDKRTAFTENFSFLKSTTLASGYTDDADALYGTSAYTLSPAQYWPNHNTHYFFRGIWPVIGDATDGSNTPTVKVSDASITVENVPFAKDKYPSDLMLGYPRTTDETCSAHSQNVAEYGICATEGDIRMNFQRVMSKIEVKLTTSAEGSKDRVTFDEHTKVEIVDGYTNGVIKLSDGTPDFTGQSKTTYGMHKVAPAHDNFLDAVIPQTLLGETDNIKFRITVKSHDGFMDKYETLLGIKSIPVEGNTIDTWEPGKHYVYILTITKTGIKVTATIKDWITATGGTSIWM